MIARRILLAGLGAMALVVGGVLAAAALIPEERVAAAVAARAEAILGEPVRIEGARVRVLPLPGVRLRGATVGAADTTAIAAADAIDLSVRLLPLFRGRVLVDRLQLDRPRLFLAIDPAGVSNLPALFGDSAAPDAAEKQAAGRDIAFAIDQIRVEAGRIGYRDARDGTVVRLDGWSQELRLAGAVRGGELAEVSLTGWVAFEDIDARLPDVVIPARDLSLRVRHDATLDRTADRLTIDDLRLALSGVTLSGTGRIDGLSDPAARTARLDLAADGLDARELLAWAPDSLRARLRLPDGSPLDVTGAADIRVTVDGPLAPGATPPFHGTLALADVGVATDEGALLSGVAGEAAFAADSVAGRVAGRLLDAPFTAAFAVRDPQAPTVAAALRGRLALGRLAALGLVADSLGLGGAADVDLELRLPLRQPARARAEGTVGLEAVRLAGVEPAVAVPAATVVMEGDSLRVRPLPLRLGPDATPLELDLRVAGWIPALLDSAAAPPRVVAGVRAADLDLDALLGPGESQYPPLFFARLRDRPLDGRSADEAAAEAGLRLPSLPPVDGEIHASIGRLVRNGMTYTDVEATARLTPRALEVTEARLGLLGGTMEARGRLEPTRFGEDGAPVEALLVGEYSLENVGAGPFFDRLTPFRDHLAGEMALAGTVAMTLDSTALPARPALQAGGTLGIAQGRLANWRVLDAVAGQLGLAAYDTVRFRDWMGSFGITGTLVTLDETVLQGRDLDARAAGAFDLGGALDLGATLILTPELAARAGAVGERAAALAGTDGRIPVGVRISGTVERPAVQLDLSEARANVVTRARDAAEAEARERGEAAARDALERLELPDSLLGLEPDSLRKVIGDSMFSLLPDSVRARGDSLRAGAEEALRSRLRKLLPGGGGGR